MRCAALHSLTQGYAAEMYTWEPLLEPTTLKCNYLETVHTDPDVTDGSVTVQSDDPLEFNASPELLRVLLRIISQFTTSLKVLSWAALGTGAELPSPQGTLDTGSRVGGGPQEVCGGHEVVSQSRCWWCGGEGRFWGRVKFFVSFLPHCTPSAPLRSCAYRRAVLKNAPPFFG